MLNTFASVFKTDKYESIIDYRQPHRAGICDDGSGQDPQHQTT